MSAELQEFLKYSEQEAVNRLLNDVVVKLRKGHYTAEGLSGETLDAVVDAVKIFTEQQINLKKKLTRIGSALSAERNLDALLEMIVLEAMNFTNADGGTLYIKTPDDRGIAFKILRTKSLNFAMGGTSGKTIPFPPVKLFKDDGSRNEQQVSAYVALTGKTVNIPDVYEVEGFDFQGTKGFDKNTGYRSKSMMVIAMRNHEDEIIGVLQLLNATDKDGQVIAFSSDYQELIESLASQAAVAITNTALIHDLKALLDSFIQVIASAIDEKSPYTGGHIRRVAELTSDIARGLANSTDEKWKNFRMNEDEHNELRIAGWMHDIGKITTPEYVVDKATKLETIYDRVNTVIAKFEIIKRDAEVEYLRQKEKLSKSKAKDKNKKIKELDNRFQDKIKQIDDDLSFIKISNIGGEFMEQAKIDRLLKIGEQKIKMEGNELPLLTENEIHNLSIKRGTLTDDERIVIQNHVVLTIKMLQKLPWPKKLSRVTEWAGGHHEKLDGTGYPSGLKAEQLSIPARIMAVADIFEALTAADRPYKPGKKISECIKILMFMVKDNHIDKDIVDFFIRSGMAQEYAKKELKDYQLDTFVYDGKEYDCRK
jgi:HD-GYP domain-containing protein (c-di-GMP phosphodiesterase class II)